MTFAILPFVVCLLVVLILWLIAEYIVRTWFSAPPNAWPHLVPLVRLIFAILVILCVLHGLGVVAMPVTLQ